MKPVSTLTLLASAFSLLLLLNTTLHAAEKQTPEEKAEAKEAADEDDRAAKIDGEVSDPLKYLVVKGTLTLDESAKGPVLGTISGKDGTYQIKLENEAVRELLFKHNNKAVTLGGKLRNKGKYLLVRDVIQGVQPAVSLSDPRSL